LFWSGYNEIDVAAVEYAETKTKAEVMTDWIHGDLFYDVYLPFHIQGKKQSAGSGRKPKTDCHQL
jgi:hypothetical protein